MPENFPWCHQREKTVPTSVIRRARTPTSRSLTGANYRESAHMAVIMLFGFGLAVGRRRLLSSVALGRLV
jgi:hypothetical protein